MGFSYAKDRPVCQGAGPGLDGERVSSLNETADDPPCQAAERLTWTVNASGGHGRKTWPVWAGRYVFQNPDDQIFKNRVLDEVMVGPVNLGVVRLIEARGPGIGDIRSMAVQGRESL